MTRRLLIVADSARVADAIRHGLHHTSQLRCLGYVSLDRLEAIPRGADAPDVIVVDGAARHGDVLTRLPAVRSAAPSCKLVLLGVRLDPAWLDQATAAGADAVLSRSLHPATLATLVREVAAGTVFHVTSRSPSPTLDPALESVLTGREREILQLVARGNSNARIARSLWVTEQTVKFHLSNVYRKLGVSNRTEASHYAYTRGLLDLRAGQAGAEDAPAPAVRHRPPAAVHTVHVVAAEHPTPNVYSTVTVLARLRGWSTFKPRSRAIR